MSLARQHVWVGPEATSFETSCEACLARRDVWSVAVATANVVGSLRREADVGFTTCRAGHRIVIHRVGRRHLSVAATRAVAHQRPSL